MPLPPTARMDIGGRLVPLNVQTSTPPSVPTASMLPLHGRHASAWTPPAMRACASTCLGSPTEALLPPVLPPPPACTAEMADCTAPPGAGRLRSELAALRSEDCWSLKSYTWIWGWLAAAPLPCSCCPLPAGRAGTEMATHALCGCHARGGPETCGLAAPAADAAAEGSRAPRARDAKELIGESPCRTAPLVLPASKSATITSRPYPCNLHSVCGTSCVAEEQSSINRPSGTWQSIYTGPKGLPTQTQL
jgi:hypothetical protein